MKRSPSCQLELTIFCLVTLGYDRMLLFSNFDERKRASEIHAHARGECRLARPLSLARVRVHVCVCACFASSFALETSTYRL